MSILSQIERNHSNPTLSTNWYISQTLKLPQVDMLSARGGEVSFRTPKGQ
ncbi:MAG: hypothetical protein P8L36_00330 [SAR324 cluster bacterium]|nr:hypothetical protein [SAR324 cluster bacterium]